MDNTDDIYYQVAGFLPNSTVNGPGIRAVIFLAGCKHNCKGCQNKSIQCYTAGERVSLDNILKMVKNNIDYITGVTLSGGEPFDQNISYLVRGLRDIGIKDIWSYTGYTYKQLLDLDKPYVNEVLKDLNVIVDGKFEESLTDNAPRFAGSSNQRFIILENGKAVDILENYIEQKNSIYKSPSLNYNN